MQCFIVAADLEGERAASLDAAAARLGYRTHSLPTLDALNADRRFERATRPLILADADQLSTDSVQSFIREHQGRAFLILLTDTMAPDDYKQLVRTGSAEWVRWEDVAAELTDLAGRLHGGASSERAAKVVSFVPSKGGVGNTTLVVETAICLASRRKQGNRIAILDLNLQGGTLADALDIEPRFDIAEIAGHSERLDAQLVDVFTSRYSQRLDVFAGPARAVAPEEVDPRIIFAFIDMISARYETVLLDLPQLWLPWTDTLLLGSDAVLVTGGYTVPALRKLSARLAAAGELGVARPQLAAVLNQVELDLLGRVTRRADIERVLAGHTMLFVRRDHAAIDEAADVGRPLTELMPGSGVSRDVKRLAQWIESAMARLDEPAPKRAVAQGSAA